MTASAEAIAITAEAPTTGDGLSAATAYEIDTAAKLQWMSEDLDAFYKLTADITVNTGDATTWETTAPDNLFTPVGAWNTQFTGQLDGQGYTISGLYINVTGDSGGLFGCVGDGVVITNFAIVNSYIASVGNGGSIVSQTQGTATGTISISKIYSDAIINAGTTGNGGGGIIGGLSGDAATALTVDSCIFAGSVTVKNYAGGILGNGNGHDGTISNCLNLGTVTATYRYSAGIVGRNDRAGFTVESCINVGELNCTDTPDTYCRSLIISNSTTKNPIVNNCYYTTLDTATRNCTESNVNLTIIKNLYGTNATVTIETWTKRADDIMIPTAITAFAPVSSLFFTITDETTEDTTAEEPDDTTVALDDTTVKLDDTTVVPNNTTVKSNDTTVAVNTNDEGCTCSGSSTLIPTLFLLIGGAMFVFIKKKV